MTIKTSDPISQFSPLVCSNAMASSSYALQPFSQEQSGVYPMIDTLMYRSVTALTQENENSDAGNDDSPFNGMNRDGASFFANSGSAMFYPQGGQDFKPVDDQSSTPITTEPSRQTDTGLTWNSGTLTNEELQTVSVLIRHKDQCPLERDKLQDKINDASTPQDLKQAVTQLQQDYQLFFAIGSQGDGRCGGKIKASDLDGFSSSHAQVGAFAEQQASEYLHNYVPSDSTQQTVRPAEMTESDALRELYRYSDGLPKFLNQDELKNIVEGSSHIGKCPAQVIAAAQYFRLHKDRWSQLTDNQNGISKEDLLARSVDKMHLTQQELDNLNTIKLHADTFFDSGDLTRDKLQAISQNNSLDSKVRQTASQLLQDPLLFGVMNNTITGYKTHHKFFDFGGGHTVDSGNISRNDFNHFVAGMSATNRQVLASNAHAVRSDTDNNAVADMLMGVEDQPAIKVPKKNGGFVLHALDEILKVGSTVWDLAATAATALSFIPGLGEVADAVGVALESQAQAAKLLRTAIDGGDMKKALAESGLSMASQAVGSISGPEAKLALREGLTKKLLEKAATASINLPIEAAKGYTQMYLDNLNLRIQSSQRQTAASSLELTSQAI